MKLTQEKFLEKIRCRHNNLYDYSFGGFKCPRCSESKGEEKIVEYLTSKSIRFTRGQKFDGCKHKYRLRFDFYLPDYNLCIEYDGRQHFKPVPRFGGEDALKEIQKHDQIKNEFCKNNNIGLLRITYRDTDISVPLSNI